MEDNLLYQNIDTQEKNPLANNANTPDTPSSNSDPNNNPANSKTKKFSIPKDPKLLVLFGLLALLAFLSLISLIVVIFRQAKPVTVDLKPTPTPKAIVSPTPINTNIPPEFQSKFEEIDKEIRLNEEFLPPDLNVEIGS